MICSLYLVQIALMFSSTLGKAVMSEKEQLEKELNDVWRKSYVKEFFNPIESNNVLPSFGKILVHYLKILKFLLLIVKES